MSEQATAVELFPNAQTSQKIGWTKPRSTLGRYGDCFQCSREETCAARQPLSAPVVIKPFASAVREEKAQRSQEWFPACGVLRRQYPHLSLSGSDHTCREVPRRSG
jgi:hypothetical protein